MLPTFHAVIRRWKHLQRDRPETADIIQPGLDKLDDYIDRILDVPAYTLAMSKSRMIEMYNLTLTTINSPVP